jgi:hypothetical protein
MPRPPNILKTIPIHVSLPEDLHARLTLHLYSSAESRVPVGAYQRFFVERITEFFNRSL